MRKLGQVLWDVEKSRPRKKVPLGRRMSWFRGEHDIESGFRVTRNSELTAGFHVKAIRWDVMGKDRSATLVPQL